MPGADVPAVENLSASTDQELRVLYADVMGELMVRRREEHRDHWGPQQSGPGPLVAVDDGALLGLYRAVHDEMMDREAKRPGTWEPDDESAQP